MIEWYKDERLGIFFDIEPDVSIRYILPWDKEDKQYCKDIIKKPFMNLKELFVRIEDFENKITYEFTIPESYCWDGASIPRIFWRLIGAKTDNRFLIPSMIHDVLCENKDYVDNDRYFADKVFERLLYVSGVPAFSRWLMFHSVDNYQKFCGW